MNSSSNLYIKYTSTKYNFNDKKCQVDKVFISLLLLFFLSFLQQHSWWNNFSFHFLYYYFIHLVIYDLLFFYRLLLILFYFLNSLRFFIIFLYLKLFSCLIFICNSWENWNMTWDNFSLHFCFFIIFSLIITLLLTSPCHHYHYYHSLPSYLMYSHNFILPSPQQTMNLFNHHWIVIIFCLDELEFI